MQVVIQLLAAFFLVGFQMSSFQFLGVNFVLVIASTCVGILIGGCVYNLTVDAELMPMLIVPQLLFSGFRLIWLQNIEAIKLAMLYEFVNCTITSCRSLLENNRVYQMETIWYWLTFL